MKSWQLGWIGAFAAILIALSVVVPPPARGQHSSQCVAASGSGSLNGRTVVIDPGHGGSDPGTANSMLIEKDLNLDIAFLLRDRLTAQGARVCLTRTTDETLSNNDRYTFANTTDGEALVSLHLNGSTDSSVDYTMTMWGKRRKDKQLAETALPYLVDELATTPDGQDTPIDSGRTGQFASGVLLKSDMPAIIVEAVFLTNTWEGDAFRDGLADGTHWREVQIADAVRDGLVAFFANQSSTEQGNGKPNPPGQTKQGK